MATRPRAGEQGQAVARPSAELRATPEEPQRLLASLTPFDVDSWRRKVTPATPQELAEMEDFLREREREREQSLQSAQTTGRREDEG